MSEPNKVAGAMAGTILRREQVYKGDIAVTDSTTRDSAPKLCECGCGKPVRKPSRRFLQGHQYQRATLEEIFEKHVSSTQDDGCWLWQGTTYPNGYGHVHYGGRDLLAHRVAWELEHGPIPDGLIVMHSCDTPQCVRGSHLQLGTHADNSADMVQKGRHNPLKGEKSPNYGKRRSHCKNGHAMTEDNVIWTNNGKARRCKICHQESNRIRALAWLHAHRELVNERKRERRQKTSPGYALGERHGLTTITESDVLAIREAARQGRATFVAIAKMFGVSPSTIGNIVHRKTWGHVP